MGELPGNLDAWRGTLQRLRQVGQLPANTLVKPHHLVIDACIDLDGAIGDRCHRNTALSNSLMEVKQCLAGDPVWCFTFVGGRFDNPVFERQVSQLRGRKGTV